MADLLDLLPVFPDDDADSIMERMIDWANEIAAEEGRPAPDTRELSMWRTIQRPTVEEFARKYDLATHEVLAAGLIATSWGDYLDLHASVFELSRNEAVKATGEVTFTGVNGTVIPAGTLVGTAVASPDDEAPEFATTEEVTIAGGDATAGIEAVEAGSTGNVAAEAITEELTVVADVDERSNDDPTVGGVDAEDDDSLRIRIMRRLRPQGPGTSDDYVTWSLDEAGVGRVTVRPIDNGPGTVTVVVSTSTGDPVAGGVVTSLQNRLDPDPGKGAGQAPIGHIVTVETTTLLDIDITAGVVELLTGYSLDGSGGTIGLQAAIEDAIRAYVDELPPGEEVVLMEVRATIMAVDGVHDAKNIALNGAANNVAPTSNQVPRLDDVTLTEGAVP